LSQTAFAAAWAAGDAMTLEEAVADAVAAPPAATTATPAPVGPPGPLSPREREVAALVARGLTNRQLAAALGIAPRTANRHVEHVLTKLGVHSRAEVAAWATVRGLTAPDDP
jgi:DNA-binding CsgD family transcriptional regulator